ncbi:conserved hypothetical protein [Talaromyces stipitatus ATCC 10500]|uniref:PEBP-like protein n=1 Tax=Talaromyces stipitatus (strain ATCC 10500 / CBS 375.48 / QM 6759 / NRRL 1006) TaxID=441959 RepID=B8MCM0_TALSN|nr:uncharacterized protein TSTA_125500 [Talaromyces stipitatus ATCC 10500]EED18836.1 conserved hypothetical protein [Talaromyces stipitatus ATCC 10500]
MFSIYLITKLTGFCFFPCMTLISTTVHAQTPPNYRPSTSNTLNVTFNEGLPISPGQFLYPSEAMFMPTLSYSDLDPFEPYIAFMIDVEVVHSGLAYPLLHWYQADLWADTTTNEFTLRNLTNAGAAYVGPQPNAGPSHSYVLLLFRQPLNYRFPECFQYMLPLSMEARAGFDLQSFIELSGLENLVAANYFLSQNPESRPTTTSLMKPPCATKKFRGSAETAVLRSDL